MVFFTRGLFFLKFIKKLFFRMFCVGLVFNMGFCSGWLLFHPQGSDLLRQLQVKLPPFLSQFQPRGASRRIASVSPPSQQNSQQKSSLFDTKNLMKHFDSFVPNSIKNTLAEYLPQYFAHPYSCGIQRVFNPSDNNARNLRIPIHIPGESEKLVQQARISPGVRFPGTAPNVSVIVTCENLFITIAPGSYVKFLRGKGSEKVLEVQGMVNFQTTGSTKMGLSFPWGVVSMQSDGPARFQWNGETNTLYGHEGRVQLYWNIGATQNSKRPLLKAQVGANADMQVIRREVSGAEEIRHLPSLEEIYFLANGFFSPTNKASTSVVSNPTVPVVPTVPVALTTPVVSAEGGVKMEEPQTPSPENATAKTEPPKSPILDSMLKSELRLKFPKDRSKISRAPASLTWHPVEGVNSYILHLSQSPTFKKFYTYKSKSTGLRISLEKQGSYYWRVYGVNKEKSQRTEFSSIRMFEF